MTPRTIRTLATAALERCGLKRPMAAARELVRSLRDQWALPFAEERLVWMFGSPRTGSTWLAKGLLAHPNLACWHEPYLGLILGCHYQDLLRLVDQEAGRPDFVFAAEHRAVWTKALGNFILENVRGRFPVASATRVVIKEPNAGQGADLIMAAVPRSRLIFLMRDPRDVLDSLLDLHRPDSWNPQPVLDTPTDRLRQVREYAEHWVYRQSVVARAFEGHHEQRRLFVKYEDLRRQTLLQSTRIYRFMDVPVDTTWLAETIARNAFENIARKKKGPSKFHRLATPGHWHHAFSPAEKQLMLDYFGPWLERYGYPLEEPESATRTLCLEQAP